MIVERIPVGAFQMNSYLAGSEKTREAVYIDPGAEVDRVLAEAERLGLSIVLLAGTHAHIDHAEGAAEARRRLGVPYWLHEAELPNLRRMPEVARMYGFEPPEVPEVDGFLVPGEALEAGGLRFEIRLTDGHAPGNVTLYRAAAEGEPGRAFVGDALFAGSVGRTDLFMGDARTLLRSIRTQLLTLPPDTIVHPGHGPDTTVGREKAANPFCQPGAERLFA
ncbi:MAG: MBL fold metallo-hydrolase [Candidatus Tectomicrobia bacterium]|uniref:MBL fold metallo-hydrolase n=1 Tax=Tectimicrobiota bacterium TaxID=2528274 RepID=A0A932I0Z1_UNCTE|nr:MBL fold metallo-hydrolase [Candidatus Tectomicrobia bacterium]